MSAPKPREDELTELAEATLTAAHVGINPGFQPEQIILARGSLATAARRTFAQKAIAAFPDARVSEQLDRNHMSARFAPPGASLADKIALGKRTLVLGVLENCLRRSAETRVHCPNYWHFSVTGFCWYDCAYCYLAGSCSSLVAPTVKVFVNLEDVLCKLRQLGRRVAAEGAGPVSCYLGKLQDGLSLDWLTGYSRALVPFFAGEPSLRWVVLTKSACVDNLIGLQHRGHVALSWSVNAVAVCRSLERVAPPVHERLAAASRCAQAGYPVRFLIMPLVPVRDWEREYGRLVDAMFDATSPSRITMGGICSFPTAARLAAARGAEPIVRALSACRPGLDGRRRYPTDLRVAMYGAILAAIQRRAPDVEVGLCLEDRHVWEHVGLDPEHVRCNCIWAERTMAEVGTRTSLHRPQTRTPDMECSERSTTEGETRW